MFLFFCLVLPSRLLASQCPAPEAFVAVPATPSLKLLTANDTIVDYLLALDVNVDGLVDIVVVNSFAGDPSIRVFAAQPGMPGSFAPHANAVLADTSTELLSYPFACFLSNTAFPDILLWQSSELAYARNVGGNLTSGLVHVLGSATSGPFSSWNPIACADVTGDGRDDIVSCDTQTNELVLYANEANGTSFSRRALLNLTDINWTGVRKWPFGLADVLLGDGGALELVAAPSLAAGLGVYETASLTRLITLDAALFPTQIHLVNLDADSAGLLDVLVCTASPDATSDTRLLAYFQSTGGSFTAAQTVADAGAPVFTLAVLDRNSDGLLDLVLSTMDFVVDVYSVVALWGTEPGKLSQAMQVHSGTTALFYCASAIAVPVAGAVAPVVAAMNDLSASLRVLSAPPPLPPANLSVTLVSAFTTTQRLRSGPSSLARALALHVRDMTADAVLDVVVVSKLGELLLAPGLGRGLFAPETLTLVDASTEYVQAAHAHAVQLVDINADGAIDILCLLTQLTSVRADLAAFLARADGWARLAVLALLPGGDNATSGVFALATYDQDGDYLPDLVLGDDGGVIVHLHAGRGAGTLYQPGVRVLSSTDVLSLLAGPLGWPQTEPVIVVALTNASILFLTSGGVRGEFNASRRIERLLIQGVDVVVQSNTRIAPCSGSLEVRPGGETAGELSNSLNNGRYSINDECTLTWRGFPSNVSVLLTVLELASEQCCDFLTITCANGTQVAALSGRAASALSFVLPANGSMVEWKSDFSITDLGFRLTWRLISAISNPPPPPPAPPAPPTTREFVSLVRLRFEPAKPSMRVSVGAGPFTTGNVNDALLTDVVVSAGANASMLVAVTQTNAYFWLDSFSGSGRRALLDGLSANAAALADFDADGDVDLLVSDGTGLQLALGPDSLWSPYPRTARELLDDAVLTACGTGFACLLNGVLASRSSACVRDTISLPSGRYTNCFGVQPMRLVSRRLLLRAAPGASVEIDCSSADGGAAVLFSVLDGGELMLGDLRIAHARSLGGAALLQVSGADSVLSLDNVTLSNCSSSGDFGGVILARDGASVYISRSSIRASSARKSGGAVALLGDGVRLEARDSTFEGCTALQGSGGAIYLDGAGVSLALERCTFCANSAIRPAAGLGEGGGGGALYLSTLSSSSSAVLSEVVFVNNSCGWFGGDVALLMGAGSARLRDVRSSGARAGLAGGSLGLALDGGARVVLELLNLSQATADWAGGAIALVRAASVIPFLRIAQASASCGAQLPDTDPVGLVELADMLSVTDAHAERYGGGLLVCGVRLAAPVELLRLSRLTAGLAGSGMYACVCPQTGVCDSVQAQTSTNVSLACGAVCVSGPPCTLVLAQAPPARHATGLAFVMGLVELRDAYGQTLRDDRVLVSLVALSDDVRVLDGTDLRVAPGELAVSLARAALAALSASEAGGTLQVYEQPSTFAFELSNSAILGGRPRLGSVAVQLTRCPERFGLLAGVGEGGLSVCASCPLGTTSSADNLAPCVALTCFDNSVLSVNTSTGEAVCQCKAGFYFSTRYTVCSACPVGALCAGEVKRPIAQPGYFPLPGADDRFVPCERPSACVGGAELCSASTTGFMCSDCRSKFFTDSTGVCAACPKRTGSVAGPLAAIPVLLILLSVLYVCVSLRIRKRVLEREREQESRLGHNDLVRARTLPRSPSMLITYLQLIGIVASANLNWSSRSKRVLNAFEYANIDLKVISTACAGTFWVQWIYTVLIPVAVAFACLTFIWLLACLAPGSLQRSDRWLFARRCFLVLGNLAYIPMSRNALLFFDCTRLPAPDRSWRLDADLTIRCSTWLGLFPIALIATLTFVLAQPVLGLIWLHRHHDDLRDATTTFWLGSLYGHLRARFVREGCARELRAVADL